MGSFLRSKNGLRHETFPKTAPGCAILDSASPFSTSFGCYFLYSLYFFLQKRGSDGYKKDNHVIHGQIFWRPWAALRNFVIKFWQC